MLLLSFLLFASSVNGYLIHRHPLHHHRQHVLVPDTLDRESLEVPFRPSYENDQLNSIFDMGEISEGSGLFGEFEGSGYEEELNNYLDLMITRLRDQYTVDGKFTPRDPMGNIETVRGSMKTILEEMGVSKKSEQVVMDAVDFAHNFLMTILAEERPTASMLKSMIAKFAAEHKDSISSLTISADFDKLRNFAVNHFDVENLAQALSAEL